MAKKIEPLFSIIITNYNNTNYLNVALESVYEQTYNNIQLIIADDASKDFDFKYWINKVAKEKSKNIVNVDFQINNKNTGTVKLLEKAIDKAKGEYILFFASDDKLANNKVIDNYINSFNKTNCNIIVSQWIICDENLNKNHNFINNKKIKMFNKNQKKLLYNMCLSNQFGSGATCYKKEIFEKYSFDKKYRLLEDWPLWLNLLKNEEKINFVNFDGLLHRTNGISESKIITDTIKEFFSEILKVYSNEIIPYYNRFGILKKLNILKAYAHQIRQYDKYINNSQHNDILKKEINKNVIIKLLWIVDKFNPKVVSKAKILLKYNKIVPLSTLLTIVFTSIIINIFKVKDYFVLIFLITLYFVIYILVTIIRNFIGMLKRK